MKNKKVMKPCSCDRHCCPLWQTGGIGGGIYVQRSKMTAEVQSVADL